MDLIEKLKIALAPHCEDCIGKIKRHCQWCYTETYSKELSMDEEWHKENGNICSACSVQCTKNSSRITNTDEIVRIYADYLKEYNKTKS